MTPKESSQKKTAAIRARLKFPNEQAFVEKYTMNVSKYGIFVKTAKPRPVGTRIKFEFQIADGTPVLRGLGEVSWGRTGSEGTTPAGMGIRFLKMDARSQKIVERIEQYRSENHSLAAVRSRYTEGLESVQENSEPGRDSEQNASRKTDQSGTQSPERASASRPTSSARTGGSPRKTGKGRRRARLPKTTDGKGLNLDAIDSLLAEIGGESGAEKKRSAKRKAAGTRSDPSQESASSSEDSAPGESSDDIFAGLPLPEEIGEDTIESVAFHAQEDSPDVIDPQGDGEEVTETVVSVLPEVAEESEPLEPEVQSVLVDLVAQSERRDLLEAESEHEASDIPPAESALFSDQEMESRESFPVIEATPLDEVEDLDADDIEELDLENLEEIEPIDVLDSGENGELDGDMSELDEEEMRHRLGLQGSESGDIPMADEVSGELEIIALNEEPTGNVARLSRLLAEEMGEIDLEEILDSSVYDQQFESGNTLLETQDIEMLEVTKEESIRDVGETSLSEPEVLLADDILEDALDDIFTSMNEPEEKSASEEDASLEGKGAGSDRFQYNEDIPETLPDEAIPEGLIPRHKEHRVQRERIPSPNTLYESIAPPPADAGVPVPEAEPTEEIREGKKKGFFKKLFG